MTVKHTLMTLATAFTLMATAAHAQPRPVEVDFMRADGSPALQVYSTGPKVTIDRILTDNPNCPVYMSHPKTLKGTGFWYNTCYSLGYKLKTLTLETDLGTFTYPFPRRMSDYKVITR